MSSNGKRLKSKPRHLSMSKGAAEFYEKLKAFGEDWGKSLNNFAKEWGEKHNELAHQLDMFRQAVAQKVSIMEMVDRVLAQSTDRIDTNALVLHKTLEQTFVRLRALEVAGGIREAAEDELNAAKEELKALITANFELVLEEKKAHEAAQEAAEKAQQEALAKQAEEAAAGIKADAAEQGRMEAELETAKTPEIMPVDHGPIEIPDGAQIFEGA